MTFGLKVPKLNSRPVYCSRLYGKWNCHFLNQWINCLCSHWDCFFNLIYLLYICKQETLFFSDSKYESHVFLKFQSWKISGFMQTYFILCSNKPKPLKIEYWMEIKRVRVTLKWNITHYFLIKGYGPDPGVFWFFFPRALILSRQFKNFCDHSRMLWEMGANLLTDGTFSAEYFLFKSGKCGNFHIVSALWQFLLHKLNSCCRKYWSGETIPGIMVVSY